MDENDLGQITRPEKNVTCEFAHLPDEHVDSQNVSVASAEGNRTERFSEKSLNLENSLKSEVRLPTSKETLQLLFVTLVTEVSLISREPNLRFERISISRRFLWKSFSSFPFCTRHDCRRGLVAGYPKFVSFGPRPLFDSVRHFILKHTFRISTHIKRFHFAPCVLKKGLFQSKSIFRNKQILASNSVMTGWSKNKARSAPATPEKNQDVDLHEEGDETGAEDHQDEQVSTVSLQNEVKDLSSELNQILGAVANNNEKKGIG
jgi:hypothetical protein